MNVIDAAGCKAPTALIGAWVLSGGPAAGAVPPELREKLRRFCGPGAQETLSGALWLVAAPETTARDGASCLALSGIVAGRPQDCTPAVLLAQWDRGLPASPAPGHYALIHADLQRKVLTLYRDLFGMARLYHARWGGLLLFSTHARALRAAGVPGGMDRETALEAVLSGDLGVLFGARTLFAGIEETLPGEAVTVSAGRLDARILPNPFVETWRDEPPPPPSLLRRDLLDAVGRGIGPESRVAVALSGGIDSTMTASMAVELLGSKNVEAFTYEFDDPTRPSEAGHAALVCRRLGIAHHVVRIAFRDYAAALPELFWLLESPRLAPGAWIPFSKALARRGFQRVLAGDGMELSLGLTEEFERTALLAKAAASPPRPWRRSPGLPSSFETPRPTSFHMVLTVLRHNGLIPDVGAFYPDSLAGLAREASESQRVRQAVALRRERPLDLQLRYYHLTSYYLHRLLRGKQTAWRDLGGAFPTCPALFLTDAPLPRRRLCANNRSLLRAAVVGVDMTADVFERPKIKDQSILPSAWSAKIAAALAPLAPEALERLGVRGPAGADLVGFYGRELALCGLWARIFDAGAIPETPPSWDALGEGRLFSE